MAAAAIRFTVVWLITAGKLRQIAKVTKGCRFCKTGKNGSCTGPDTASLLKHYNTISNVPSLPGTSVAIALIFVPVNGVFSCVAV